MNGEVSDSNMNIIDRAYKKLADDIDDLEQTITDEQIDALFE